MCVVSCAQRDAPSERPWSKYSTGSSLHDKKQQQQPPPPPSRSVNGATKRDASTVVDSTASDASDAAAVQTAARARAKNESLDEFVAASRGKKLKAWQNDFDFPLAAPVDERASSKKRKPNDAADDDDDDGATDVARDDVVTPSVPSRTSKDKSKRAKVDAAAAANAVDRSVVFDDAVSDLDYLRKRMVQDVDSDLVDEKNNNDDDNLNNIDDNGNDDNDDDNVKVADTAAEADVERDSAASIDNSRLYVRNLAFSTTPDELRTHCERYGTVVEVK